jgi:hypothetical protein
VVTSGATFAVGTTTVSCTAVDGGANTSSAKSFTVSVRSASQQVITLQTNVQAVVNDSSTRTNLVSILQNAQAAIARGDTAGACDKMTSFISQVQAQSGKKIVKKTAEALITDGRRIKSALGCA